MEMQYTVNEKGFRTGKWTCPCGVAEPGNSNPSLALDSFQSFMDGYLDTQKDWGD